MNWNVSEFRPSTASTREGLAQPRNASQPCVATRTSIAWWRSTSGVFLRVWRLNTASLVRMLAH
jgi:hypothetical protein